MTTHTSSDSGPQLFHCPTCGAALPAPDNTTVRCEYCGSEVLVPPEYRRQPAQPPPVVIQTTYRPAPISTPVSTTSASKRSSCASGLVLVVLIGGFLFLILGINFVANNQDSLSSLLGLVPSATPTLPPAPTPIPIWTVETKFVVKGSEPDQSGPGIFVDPRYVLPEKNGNYIVGDYSSGQVMQFDLTGKLLWMINIQSESTNTIIRGMALNSTGQFIIASDGNILFYNAADGKPVSKIPGYDSGASMDLYYDVLAIDPSDNLYALSRMSNHLDLYKFDTNSTAIWQKKNFLQGAVGKNQDLMIDHMAADSQGSLYVMDRKTNQVYKFDANGNFAGLIGSAGHGPDQYVELGPIAVDNQEHVFLFDREKVNYLLKVYDSRGSYMTTIPYPKDVYYPEMITFDSTGKLVLITNQGEVFRLSLNPQALKK